MKIRLIASCIIFIFVLSGCSILESVNRTIDYVDQTTNYLNQVTDFVNEVPALAKQAVTDEQALTELESKLILMKENIQSFNELEAPEIASDLHQNILETNQTALDGIDTYLSNIQDGVLDPAVIENTELFQSFQEITNIIEKIQQLGL